MYAIRSYYAEKLKKFIKNAVFEALDEYKKQEKEIITIEQQEEEAREDYIAYELKYINCCIILVNNISKKRIVISQPEFESENAFVADYLFANIGKKISFEELENNIV